MNAYRFEHQPSFKDQCVLLKLLTVYHHGFIGKKPGIGELSDEDDVEVDSLAEEKASRELCQVSKTIFLFW